MFQLGQNTEPHWLDLPRGVRVQVRPLTARLYQRAVAKAQGELRELKRQVEGVKKAGGRVEDLPDLEDKNVAIAESQVMFVDRLAVEAIVAWEGVADGAGDPASVTTIHVRDLMADNRINESFVVQYVAAHEKRLAEGNASAPSPNGTSAGARSTAKAAGKTKNPARKGRKAATENSAPTGSTSREATKATAFGS